MKQTSRKNAQSAVKSILSVLTIAAVLLVNTVTIGAIDKARLETRTDLAAETFNATGEGVIVAILDRGIDWKNHDFRNDDGTTRIKYIFDLSSNAGATDPGNTYGRGTIYTEAQINAALSGGPDLATRDAVGHGTTTTALAAGDGSNRPDRKYRGIAPKASIIAVKVTSEGAPAHDGQPAEAVFNDYSAYPVAIDFVRDKSAELNMPAVMLLNLGSLGGPSDGSSTLARKIDATVGPGKPGIVFVTGPGDDGGNQNHAAGNVVQGQTTSIQIQKIDNNPLRFDLWYPGADRFTVSLQTPSGNFGPYAPPANGSTSNVANPTFNYNHRGVGTVFFGSNNGKREILIDISGPAGAYTIQLAGTTVTTGAFNAILNPSTIYTNNRFLNHVVPGSIWEGASAFNNISPNSYVVETNWTDIDGIPRSIVGQGNIGELWTGSSVGPTFDGRLGVDLSAPGDLVMTTYNPTSWWSTFRHNLVFGGSSVYGRAGAVSAAAPQVTGLIALILQQNPDLDAIQVRDILRRSARRDSFTGSVPNPNWGYGKMDTYNAVLLARNQTLYDYDGDGKSDPSVFRASNGTWYVSRSGLGDMYVMPWGLAGDNIVPADYDGDGKTDLAVRRPADNNFYIFNSSNSTMEVRNFGIAGDVALPSDYNGDGKADVAVWRPSDGTWYLSLSGSGIFYVMPWGLNGDKPVPGDFDGDGKTDLAVFRPAEGRWYIFNTVTGSMTTNDFGINGDQPVQADYSGDGKTDFAVYRPSNNTWYRQHTNDGTFNVSQWGLPGDFPVPGDFDGDGKSDVAVWRPSDGTWYVLKSTSGVFTQSFGTSGDIPTPNAFVY